MLSQFVSIDMVPPMTLLHAKHCIPLLEQKLDDLKRTSSGPILPQIICEDEADIDEESDDITDNLENQTQHIRFPEQRSCSIEELLDDSIHNLESEQPDDHSDQSSLTKQLSHTSDEDSMDSIMHKLTILDSLYQMEMELKTSDNVIA